MAAAIVISNAMHCAAVWTRMLSSAAGRDKWMRTVQYSAKTYATYLESRNKTNALHAPMNALAKYV
jgi:hypothetical protein